ncbi:hypothetical protein ACH5RR_025852 [Cinchona calisaya]|uniref:Uncharacterized protein n=1 Tax=Cinchona calisaya TaxID=153742 RepID=A0ABD2Z473_9GENT
MTSLSISIAQEKRTIPLEIWPGPDAGSWNTRDNHPYWARLQQAKQEYLMAFQDSQNPYSQEFSKSSQSQSPEKQNKQPVKERSAERRMRNKRRNRAKHEYHIELLNFTDPDSTPSETDRSDDNDTWNY